MQINFDNYEDLRDAGFWNAPQLYNASQAVENPAIYAPYGTPGFWQPASASSIAPNSGRINTVRGAMSASSSAARAAIPPATPAIAAATGQPLAPITLVAPMPSITAVPNAIPGPSGVGCWVNANPILAVAAGLLGVWFLSR
jgi:hypothetical protein